MHMTIEEETGTIEFPEKIFCTSDGSGEKFILFNRSFLFRLLDYYIYTFHSLFIMLFTFNKIYKKKVTQKNAGYSNYFSSSFSVFTPSVDKTEKRRQ